MLSPRYHHPPTQVHTKGRPNSIRQRLLTSGRLHSATQKHKKQAPNDIHRSHGPYQALNSVAELQNRVFEVKMETSAHSDRVTPKNIM
jgi:hypothetical protein